MSPGATRRSDCGKGRATYRPDWDAARPWVLYSRGAALAFHAATERGAMAALERYGYRFRRSELQP